MATKGKHGLLQTDCPFQVRGIVTGVDSNRFYQSGTTKTGGQWNKINFGVKVNENKTVYVSLNGFPRKEVFYYKKPESKGEKGTTVRVPWKDRTKSPGEGYRLIGVNITTDKDKDGNNINNIFTEYDAVEWFANNLKDGESVFIRGNIDFSSYTNRNGQTQRRVDMVLNQLSRTKSPVDFEADNFEEQCDFICGLVYSDIDKEVDESNKPTGRFILSGYSIGYNSIENISFIIDTDHDKLASRFKKSLKPGNYIQVYGKVDTVSNIEEVEVDSGWGEPSKMKRVSGSFRTEYVIYGADPNSIDTEMYSEADIAAAIKKIKAAKDAEYNFGDTSDGDADWGEFDDSDDDDLWV